MSNDKFKVGDKVKVISFYMNGIMKDFNSSDMPSEIQKLKDKVLEIVKPQEKENLNGEEVRLYKTDVDEEFYESELIFAKIDNWKEHMEEEK